jgi:hypothetical protein
MRAVSRPTVNIIDIQRIWGTLLVDKASAGKIFKVVNMNNYVSRTLE